MLTIVTDRESRVDTRDLIFLTETWRPLVGVLVELLLLPLLGLTLVLSDLPWGWLLIGAAVACALSRYGPRWWPGKR